MSTHHLDDSARLHLYWVPLGAGERPGQGLVRLCGRAFEAISALIHRRRRCDLFHAALVAELPGGVVCVEVAPEPDENGRMTRGVVAEGAVGWRPLARFRTFRYEVRRWPNGTIPDLSYAIESPVLLTSNPWVIERLLEQLPEAPTPVWGRDELRAGEMWNSNSIVAWALTRVALEDAAGLPPNGGRAPGWNAGVEVADRPMIALE